MQELTPRDRKDRIVAASVTLALAIILLLTLRFGTVGYDSQLTADNYTAELAPPDDEELFLEPELLNLGEEEATTHDAPSQSVKGNPELAETDHSKVVAKGDNPKPAPAVEKPVTQKQESPVQATTPSATDKEREKATSTVAKGFAPRNGNPTGDTGGSGAGDSGVGVAGNLRGRTFQGCPSPKVQLRHKTVVKVDVVVDEDGRVISASASGSADASIRRQCEQAARQARWSAKKGAGETRGSITFTITPK